MKFVINLFKLWRNYVFFSKRTQMQHQSYPLNFVFVFPFQQLMLKISWKQWTSLSIYQLCISSLTFSIFQLLAYLIERSIYATKHHSSTNWPHCRVVTKTIRKVKLVDSVHLGKGSIKKMVAKVWNICRSNLRSISWICNSYKLQ